MKNDLLEEIIDLEKQLQQELAQEEQRSQDWKNRELAALDREFEETRQAMETAGQQALDRQKMQVEQESAQRLQAAQAWIRRLQEIDEERLRDALNRHLAVLLPEIDHDHPHGKG